MKEKLTAVGEKVKTFFGKMGKKTRTLLGIVLAAILIGSIAIAVVLNNKPYSALFTGLASEEAQSIMAYLDENGYSDYRLEGSTIMVPRDQEVMLKSKLIMEQYPKTGYAYESYFEHVSAMSTETERKTAFKIGLQDRLAAVIRNLDGVRDASVQIEEGSDNNYILDSGKSVDATAAVMVTMDGVSTLSSKQASAIRNFVSRSVQGLNFENVSIIDSAGNTYNAGGDSLLAGDSAALKLSLEEQVNNRVRTEVLQALVPIFGEENVRVSVNSTVDVSKTVGETTSYTSPPGAPPGEGIIGSKVFNQEAIKGGEGGAGGVVGAGPNSDISTYVENELDNIDGDQQYLKNSGEEEHKVDTQIQQREVPAGTITDVMVAVSINDTALGSTNLASLESHVARAAGISATVQADKISILPAPFYEPPSVVPPGPIADGLNIPPWMLYAAAGGAALLLLLIIILVILRKKSRKKKARQLEAMLNSMPMQEGMEGAPPDHEGADIMNIRTEKSMELRKGIREFAETSPELAAQMVKSWLKGDEEAHG